MIQQFSETEVEKVLFIPSKGFTSKLKLRKGIQKEIRKSYILAIVCSVLLLNLPVTLEAKLILQVLNFLVFALLWVLKRNQKLFKKTLLILFLLINIKSSIMTSQSTENAPIVSYSRYLTIPNQEIKRGKSSSRVDYHNFKYKKEVMYIGKLILASSFYGHAISRLSNISLENFSIFELTSAFTELALASYLYICHLEVIPNQKIFNVNQPLLYAMATYSIGPTLIPSIKQESLPSVILEESKIKIEAEKAGAQTPSSSPSASNMPVSMDYLVYSFPVYVPPYSFDNMASYPSAYFTPEKEVQQTMPSKDEEGMKAVMKLLDDARGQDFDERLNRILKPTQSNQNEDKNK